MRLLQKLTETRFYIFLIDLFMSLRYVYRKFVYKLCLNRNAVVDAKTASRLHFYNKYATRKEIEIPTVCAYFPSFSSLNSHCKTMRCDAKQITFWSFWFACQCAPLQPMSWACHTDPPSKRSPSFPAISCHLFRKTEHRNESMNELWANHCLEDYKTLEIRKDCCLARVSLLLPFTPMISYLPHEYPLGVSL